MRQEIKIEFIKGTHIEQIERACFYLTSIFEALDANPQEDVHPIHSNAIVNLAQIGTAFADSIYANISDFIEPDEDKELDTDSLLNTSELTEAPKTDFKGLASLLSQVLRHPDTPPHLWSELMQAVNSTHSDGDNDLINEMETSPEMLETILTAYHKRHGEDDEN